jgi:predicted small secreted protein
MNAKTSEARRLALLLGAVGAGWAMMLAGCNTVEGVGEDVGAAGRGISNAADETQDAIFEEDNENYR